MKKQLIFTALGAMLLASCADTWDRVYEGGDPQKEGYEYLADYDPLKDNVDRSKYPNFKVALALAASDYNKQELVYALANSNFDELVTGNAMKMASCVNDKGEMSFNTVTEFVNNATDAGMNVYGHTLAWHSQQPIKWLSSLIADKELPVDPNAANDFIIYNCGDTPGANTWDKQAILTLTTPMEKGVDYTFKMRAKASQNCNLDFWPIWDASSNKNQWGGSNDVQYLTLGSVGTEWTDVVCEFNANFPHDKLQFVFGKHSGTIAFDDLQLVKKGTEDNMIENGDFANPVTSGWTNNWNGPSFEIAQEGTGPGVELPSYLYENDFESGDVPGGWGNGSTREIVDMDGGKVLKLTNPSVTNFWSAQMAVDFSNAFEQGTKYFMHIKIKGSANGIWRSGFQVTSDYSSAGDFKNIEFTTDWTEHTLEVTCNKEGGTRFIHSFGDFAGDIYIDDLQLYTVISSNTIPLTPEEKKDTLTWAMDKWIGGMMEACAGKVKAWDVVNEAISGGNPDSEGVFALQHSEGYKPGGTWDVGGDAFYWQDYLGDLDYVRTAVASARKHFEANGGTPSDLKLFVNDYNLESDWDNNGKLKSLIAWIKRWEADGVTKIDGIGTQMHISCYMNPQIQESKKKHITQMFELMAASGKLCRVSELDMGLVDAAGNTVKTADVTEEQHKAMAEMYKFVVSEYLRIIPADQQWGICQWCATDAPASSGWRGGEPVGLWDSNYYRKHTYAGFADGLSGK